MSRLVDERLDGIITQSHPLNACWIDQTFLQNDIRITLYVPRTQITNLIHPLRRGTSTFNHRNSCISIVSSLSKLLDHPHPDGIVQPVHRQDEPLKHLIEG